MLDTMVTFVSAETETVVKFVTGVYSLEDTASVNNTCIAPETKI